MEPKTSHSGILLIDDEPEILIIIKELLSCLNLPIHTAENGQIGLELIKNLKPQVIISDFNMPKLDGLELLMFVRDLKIMTPVIWLTGNGSTNLFKKAWASGVFDILEKPFKDTTLKECVESALSLETKDTANRIPNFMGLAIYKKLEIALDKANFQKLMELSIKKGLSMSSMINQLIEVESGRLDK